jgi:hypothetical protein
MTSLQHTPIGGHWLAFYRGFKYDVLMAEALRSAQSDGRRHRDVTDMTSVSSLVGLRNVTAASESGAELAPAQSLMHTQMLEHKPGD